MDKKNRIAVILLVIAIILSIISIVIRVSIDSLDDESEEAPVKEHSNVQGTVQLIVEKSGGVENGEG
jgi:hypothetical protein